MNTFVSQIIKGREVEQVLEHRILCERIQEQKMGPFCWGENWKEWNGNEVEHIEIVYVSVPCS